MKQGLASRQDAFSTGDNTMICGVVSETPAPSLHLKSDPVPYGELAIRYCVRGTFQVKSSGLFLLFVIIIEKFLHLQMPDDISSTFAVICPS